jgi:hypothetical protein
MYHFLSHQQFESHTKAEQLTTNNMNLGQSSPN